MACDVAVVLALSMLSTPARAQVSVQGEPISMKQAHPGQTYTGVIVVKNSSDEVQEAKVYQTDYLRLPDATTIYGDPGSVARSNAPWISISSRVVVPPRQTMEIPYTVTVPSRESLSGSYWSMVMVETVPRGSPESSQQGPPSRPGQVSLITRFRYAVQVVSNVGDRAKRAARFEAPGALTAKDSTKALQFDLRNSGEVAFAPAFALELYAEDGRHVKTLTAVRELTYPGMVVRQLFPLGRLPAGQYKAIVTVDTGADAVFGAQYTFKL